MVEQVRINPTEVRGYGNVCEEHSLDDFIVSSSGLAKEKENVHGALTEVYKLVYSLYGLMFDFDKGNKQLYLQMAEADTLSFGFDTANKQLYLVDEDDTGFWLVFDEDTHEVYITDEAPPSISISASSPYLLSGETTDLIVTLYDGVGAPLANKSVTVSDGTSVYSGITNNNGLFILYDVEVSADTTFTATYSSVSDTCTVEKCLFVDYGVTGKSNLSNITTQGSTTVTDTGTLVELGNYTTFYLRPNSFGLFTAPFTVKMTVIGGGNSTSTKGRLVFQPYNSSTTSLGGLDTGTVLESGDELRCDFTSTQAKLYRNGTLVYTRDYTSTSQIKVNIYNNQTGCYIKYKDLRIREG